jgi:hypothetical protein
MRYHFQYWINKYKKSFSQILLLFEYYLKNIKSLPVYQNMISKFYGLSIAKKINHSLHLKYLYDGKVYEIYLPIENRLRSRMINEVIELEKEGENGLEKIKLNQQPGIPFLVNAKQIGVNKIIISNYSEGEEKVYQGNDKVSF